MNEELTELIVGLNQKIDVQNSLLEDILEQLREGSPGRGAPSGGGRKKVDLKILEEIEDDIDIEWWFQTYGEEPLPAKYMTAVGSGISFTKPELDCLFARLQEFKDEPLENKTHIWKYLGKVWCPREKNARNCFACVPIKGGK